MSTNTRNLCGSGFRTCLSSSIVRNLLILHLEKWLRGLSKVYSRVLSGSTSLYTLLAASLSYNLDRPTTSTASMTSLQSSTTNLSSRRVTSDLDITLDDIRNLTRCGASDHADIFMFAHRRLGKVVLKRPRYDGSASEIEAERNVRVVISLVEADLTSRVGNQGTIRILESSEAFKRSKRLWNFRSRSNLLHRLRLC